MSTYDGDNNTGNRSTGDEFENTHVKSRKLDVNTHYVHTAHDVGSSHTCGYVGRPRRSRSGRSRGSRSWRPTGTGSMRNVVMPMPIVQWKWERVNVDGSMNNVVNLQTF